MYVAELLTRAGCSCGHEDFFPKAVSPTAYWLARVGVKPLLWPRPPYGEAAWEAAPYLPYLPRNSVIFHQIRRPMDFIRSRQRKGLSRAAFRNRNVSVQAPVSNKYRFWEFPLAAQVEYLAEFWIEWNDLVERRAAGKEYHRYRVDELDADKLGWMLETVGCSGDEQTVAQAYRETSRTTNRGKPLETKITEALLAPDLRKRLEAAAGHYGVSL